MSELTEEEFEKENLIDEIERWGKHKNRLLTNSLGFRDEKKRKVLNCCIFLLYGNLCLIHH